jgi:hypothetical protein
MTSMVLGKFAPAKPKALLGANATPS